MQIHGFQKLTLLDFPQKTACTLFLAGCDFRCSFCHNSGLVLGDLPPETNDEEVLRFLKKRRGLLDGVAVTGGEPLLSPALPELLRKIRDLGFAVKLDTNGNHPERLREMIEKGLVQYVAMDVKNAPEKYGTTVGIPDLDIARVDESIRMLLHGTVEYEFRTTAVRELHDEDSFRAIGAWLRGAARYYIQCFTDRDTVMSPGLHAPSNAELQRFLDAVKPFIPSAALRGV